MAVNLSPVGGVAGQFFDNNGDPLVGGKLYTYAAGTTTPQATYTSSSGATANSNPIILNAGGRVPSEIWLTDGLAYKFVLYSATDQLIGSWDNISGINSNFVNYTASQEIQTATSGQTVFTLTTMQYQPGTNSLTVYVDGVNQYGPGALYSYVETDSTTVTFNNGLHVGAEVKFTTVQQATSSATDAAQVAYQPAGSGAVTTTVQAKLRETVSVKDFGAVGDGVTDDTAAIQAALTSGASEVVFPDGVYAITSLIAGSALTVSDLKISGSGTVLCGTAGIQLDGDNNTVEGIVVKRATKSTSPVMIYTNYGLGIFGDNNTVRNVEIYNMNGSGITIGGKNNTVDGAYCHDNIAGMICQATTRNITVVNSRFVYNDVNNDSGADGILMSRSVIGATVDSCDLSYNGEHGLYFQGQFGVFTNNRVFSNAADGLKFGSYDDGNYEYPGETLDKWVSGSPGVPGYGGVIGADGFGMAHIIISGNNIFENLGGTGIYFQPSSRNVVVDGNTVVNNDIRWVYFNYTGANARLEDHYNISVTNNNVRGVNPTTSANSKIDISAYAEIFISGNSTFGNIATYAADATTAPRLSDRSQNPQVVGNSVASTIIFSRYTEALCEGNTMANLSLGADGGADIIGNKITNAGNIDISRINVFSNNKIACLSMRGAASGAITSFTGNDVSCSIADGNYSISGVSATTSALAANGAIVSGNRFSFAQYQGISAGSTGANLIFSNNVIVPPAGTATSDWVFRLYGSRDLVNGNNLTLGTIRTNGSNASICNNITAGAISDGGSGNTLVNNTVV